MNDPVVEFRASMQDQHEDAFSSADVPPPPPPPHRRPRVREVSSRFMSPMVSSSSSSTGDLHLSAAKSPLPKHAISTPAELQSRQQQQRSNSVQRSQHQELEPLCSADENRPETMRSSETPLGLQCKAPIMSSQRKPRAMKLFKENGGRGEQQRLDPSRPKTSDSGKLTGRITPSRPDTPTVSSVDRLASARLRLTTQTFQPSTNIPTAAVKLLQSSGMSLSAQSQKSQEATSIPLKPSSLDDDGYVNKGSAKTLATNPASNDSGSCTTDQGSTFTSSPFPAQNCKARSLPDIRSSMPETDMSTRLLAERNYGRDNVTGSDSSKFYASPCSRSLNLSLSNSEHSLYYSAKTNEKVASLLSKPYTNTMKMPPHPPCTKLALDARKGRKVSSHQEDVHSLRMLHNHYLQWRYVNAKAEASMHAQRRETERTLHSLNVKISDLCDSVRGKRIKLVLLQRIKNLSTILDTQMPYLDEWSALEEDYSTSLSGAIQALLNASVQLPVSGNVRLDTREIGEALNSAFKVMEIIAFHVQRFMPKAEEMDNLISELAKVIRGERALVEECGDLLSSTCISQVEECSLRGQLIQLIRSSLGQTREE